jgi:EAL domain-containing protein (putative c-di-GMP-specific phosphodiesterase class I)
MQRDAVPDHELALDLEQAVERKQLHLHYQPIVDLASGEIREVEALARWMHPRFGPIPADRFIPLAERSDLILKLGRWVLGAACRQARAWQLQFPDRPALTVNVNLSPVQLHQPGLTDLVRATLRETTIEPAQLQLEITESQLVRQSTSTLHTLQSLRKLGVAIAIDDFGTGYSAFSYLRWIPATVLKLDRSFVRGLGKHPHDAAIVRGMVAIARDLGLAVTAEGVESEAQSSHLRTVGCDQAQGFLFGRPMPPDELAMLLAREQASPQAAGSGTTTDKPAEPRAERDQRNVLVVDDDDHIRGLTSLALEMEGYEVLTAAHGNAALEQVRRRTPGVILLDMWMPVMDGRAFSRAYRELPGPHAPIVLLTANPDGRACAAQVGASAYLAKPFEVDELISTVSDLVHRPN